MPDRTLELVALAGVGYALEKYRRHLIRTTSERVRRETRRHLIEHLRQSGRGLVMLDYAVLANSEVNGSVTVLGDDTVVTGNYFAPEAADA